MNNLIIKATNVTPEVNFNLNGEFSIKGVSYPEIPQKFYIIISQWITKYIDQMSPEVFLTLHLEYLNTGSKSAILQILDLLIKKCADKHNLHITWIHDTEDDDLKEEGEMIRDVLNFPFIFKNVT